MKSIIISQVQMVNEAKINVGNLLIKVEPIKYIDPNISHLNAEVVDAECLFLMPRAIDDQVHFREQGLNHKENIYSKSRAAVALASFLEMPNTNPHDFTQALLEDKFRIAACFVNVIFSIVFICAV